MINLQIWVCSYSQLSAIFTPKNYEKYPCFSTKSNMSFVFIFIFYISFYFLGLSRLLQKDQAKILRWNCSYHDKDCHIQNLRLRSLGKDLQRCTSRGSISSGGYYSITVDTRARRWFELHEIEFWLLKLISH